MWGRGERREVVPGPFTVPLWRALDDVQHSHPQVAMVVEVVVGMPGGGGDETRSGADLALARHRSVWTTGAAMDTGAQTDLTRSLKRVLVRDSKTSVFYLNFLSFLFVCFI